MTRSTRTRAIGIGITIAAAITIGFLTLSPEQLQWDQVECCQTTDFVLNIALFIPLGIGLGVTGFSGLAALLAGAVLSGVIELSQVSLVTGRDASLHDVVSNAFGAGAGVFFAHHWETRQVWWKWVGGALSGVFIMSAILGPWLVLPDYPSGRPWYSQWQHDFRAMATFPGRVLSFTMQSIELPDGVVEYPERLQQAIERSDSTVISLRIETGPPVRGRAQLAGLVVGWPGPWIIHLVQEDTSLLVRSRLKMSSAGFASPTLRMPGALPATAGDTVGVRVSISPKAIRILVDGPAPTQETFRLSTDWAWAAFLPIRELGVDTRDWIRGAATLLALFLLGLGARGKPWLQGFGILAWLLGGPLLFGLSPASGMVMAFGFLGLVLGNLVGRALKLA
jgi:hypothetical protein